MAAPATTDGTATLSTGPEGRRPAPAGTLRRWWRQLTSMRTALLLLLLLAIAAAPGSLLPQRRVNPEMVSRYFLDHPGLAPWLDRAGLFDVYASPWFAAIYLLLFLSLVGCLAPRIRLHARALLRRPPAAPRHLDRLAYHSLSWQSPGPTEQAAQRVRRLLRRRGWRAVIRPDAHGIAVCAEKGYLRETGNILFHLSLVGMLVGVAVGAGYGWHANRILVAGPDQAFCNTLQQYDEYSLGARLQPGDLAPFCVRMTRFTATYLPNGQPTTFRADVRYRLADGPETYHRLEVNQPLRMPGANLYLLGHGYAPTLRYTDRYGHSQTTTAPFLPTDQMGTARGAISFPDANLDPKRRRGSTRDQIGFQGMFFPTTARTGGQTSTFPAARDPSVLLFGYAGDLGVDAGIPHSVYSLDQAQITNGQLTLVQRNPKLLRPGQSWRLPGDRGTVTFVGYRQWISISVRHDPGEPIMLASLGLLLAGLISSLSIRRRRIWIRFDTDRGQAQVGGLTRQDRAGFAREFRTLTSAARRATGLEQ